MICCTRSTSHSLTIILDIFCKVFIVPRTKCGRRSIEFAIVRPFTSNNLKGICQVDGYTGCKVHTSSPPPLHTLLKLYRFQGGEHWSYAYTGYNLRPCTREASKKPFSINFLATLQYKTISHRRPGYKIMKQNMSGGLIFSVLAPCLSSILNRCIL